MLINVHFTIVTDCQALIYLNMHRTKNAQIVRWHYQLSEYDYNIVHRSSDKMLHADALSRSPLEIENKSEKNNCNVEIDNLSVFIVLSEESEIAAFQYRDEYVSKKKNILNKPVNERSAIERREVEGFVLKGGILYKRIDNKLLYVVPNFMRKLLVVRFHDFNGHPGVDHRLNLINKKYNF